MQEPRKFEPRDWAADNTLDEADAGVSPALPRFLITGCALLVGLTCVYLCYRALRQRPNGHPQVLHEQPAGTGGETISEEAIAVASLLIERFPNSPDALNVAGWTRYSFGNSAAAMEYWEKSLTLDPSSGVPYFCMGRVAAERGDHQKAAELFRKSLSLDPNSADAQVRLAQALMQLGKAKEVVDLLEGNVPADFASLEHLLLLGEAYLQLKEYGKAKERLQVVVKLAPTDREAHYLLATAFSKLGENDKAAEYLERVKRLHDAERRSRQMRYGLRGDAATGILASIYLLAGQVYYDRGILAEAEAHWQKGRAVDPADTKARRALAQLCQMQGRIAESLEILEEIRQIEPENVFPCLDMGVLYAQLGQLDASEATLKEIVERVPESAIGYTALVRLYLVSNRKLEEATELAQTAVELEPVASNYFLLSSVYQRTGDLERALAAIERAMELDPVNREYQRTHELIREKL